MPEPQPESTPPAGQSPPSEPPTPAPTPDRQPDEPTATTPDLDQATVAAPGSDQVKQPAAPRWTGSAAVPPPEPKKRRSQGGEERVPIPRDPTLELPVVAPDPPDPDSRDHDTPVDPWAAADPEPWAAHVASYSPAEPYQPSGPHPPVRPYPPAQSFPVSPAPAPPAGAPPPPPPPPAQPVAPPPPPAPVGKDPARTRRGRRDQGTPPPGSGPTPAVPPGWRPPPGYVAATARRRRRWPRVMLVLTLLTLACCCGAPTYFAKPMWEQYPASATLPAELMDLHKREDQTSVQVATQLKQQVVTDNLLLGDGFAGVYSDPNGKLVTIFGTTGFRWNPQQDLDTEMARLTSKYALNGITSIETGVRGEYQRCGVGQAGRTDVVVCAWADHGSLGTAVFTRLSVQDSADLLARLRTEIISRG